MHHIHLGGGALGLGLVVPTIAAVPNIPITIVQRSPEFLKPLQGRLMYTRQSWSTGPRGVSITAAIDFEDEPAIRRAVLQPEDMLLTTALTDAGLDGKVDFLDYWLSERAEQFPDSQLCVIPCENILGSKYESLERKDFGPGICFIRCMVDRLCSDRRVANGALEVKTEDYGNWVIQKHGPGTLFLEEALGSAEVGFVDDLQPYLRMKQWLVNGAHFALGTMAWADRYYMLHSFAQTHAGRQFLSGVLGELGDAYASQYSVDEGDLRIYCEAIFDRFSTYPFPVDRVIGRLAEEKIFSCLEAVYQRMIAPAAAFHAAYGQSPEHIILALRTLHELIHKEQWVEQSSRT
jgi:hypothetical protein